MEQARDSYKIKLDQVEAQLAESQKDHAETLEQLNSEHEEKVAEIQ